MSALQYRTKGNSSPKGKPRVYFTCHPEDFESSFDKICEDIFKTHDCTVYYTADMNEEFAAEDKATDLGSMNLFVIPVTFRLLTTPNRAMDSDFAYAIAEHIPVLPIMLESGIDELYARPDKFGELQYLNPYSTDVTEIGYEEKLKKYLESVLISDEMAKRIRAAFDAYIFLSYRKKDRRYANELMRLIHAKPEFRDIAIWYDEFLTPGESFNENIGRMLNDSKLFALLVTPSLLEEPGGKPNFVMGEEYPAAREKGMDIVPAEMESTDKDELCSKFADIPECVDPRDDEAFKAILLQSITKIAVSVNDNNPEHNFLIGLAYLDGIDVEVDRERGLELITSAAEANLPEAMQKLYDMYYDGIGVGLDWQEAIKWAEKLAEYYINEYGEEHPDTIVAISDLALNCIRLGDFENAAQLYERVYVNSCKVFGEEHIDTVTTFSNLAAVYGELGDVEKALECGSKAYSLCLKVLGREHPKTMIALSNLASAYNDVGDYENALSINREVYELQTEVLGQEHPETLTTLNNLAETYSNLSEFETALALKEKAYTLRAKVLGEEHPDTVDTLIDLAFTYGAAGQHERSLELKGKAYFVRCKLFGNTDDENLALLKDIADGYSDLGNYKKALEFDKLLHAARCELWGTEHPKTLAALHNIALDHSKLGEYNEAIELFEKVYESKRMTMGESDSSTIKTLYRLAETYEYAGKYQQAAEGYEKVYAYRLSNLGKEHIDTVKVKEQLQSVHKKLDGGIFGAVKKLFNKKK